MSIFGIPLFVPYETYKTFVITNFDYVVSNDFMYVGYLMINAMYLFALYLFFKFTYKVVITIINHFI